MGFFDIYRYMNERVPMGRGAAVSVDVPADRREAFARWLAEHGGAAGADDGRCWYCGERDAAGPVGVVVKKGLAVQHVVSMSVPVPSCSACREALVSRARAVKRLHNVGFVAGLAGVITLVAIEGQAPSDWIKAILFGVIVTFFVAGVVGSSVGWIAVRAAAGKIGRLRSELDHPLVQKARQDGWRPG